MTYFVALCEVCEDDTEVVGVSVLRQAAEEFARRDAWEVAAAGGGVPWSRNNYVRCDDRGWPHGRHLTWRIAEWSQ